MSKKLNPIQRVLVATSNTAVLAKDLTINSLTPGKLGFFDYDTNLSVDATNIVNKNRVYIALGVDKTGSGTLEDVYQSGGQFIQKNRISNYSLKCYSPAQPKVMDVTNFKAQCDTEYGIKIQVGSEEGRRMHGMSLVNKTFLVKTSCCKQEDCTSCPEGDCNELAKLLYSAINSDVEKIFKAEFLDYTTTPGTPVIVAPGAVDAWIVANTNVGTPAVTNCLGLRITTIPSGMRKYCNILADYFQNRSVDMNVSLIAGFSCNGKVTLIQDNKIEEGLGFDIRAIEYSAGGFNGKPGPYRLSTLAGFPLEGFESNVTDTAKYTQVYLNYGNDSVSGFQDFSSNVETLLVFPCANSTALASFLAVMDAYTNGLLDAKVDDGALCNCTGATVTNKDTDGLD